MIKTKFRKSFLFLIIFGLTVAVFSIYHRTILITAGAYLTPVAEGNADVVIVEGTELISEKSINIAIDLLSSGKTGRLVIVYQNCRDEPIFARDPDYYLILMRALKERGVEDGEMQVIEVPKNHPITLTEAQIVLSNLHKQGVKSAILLADGFHMRRSLWTYRQVGLPMDISIIPYPYFLRYRNEDWWLSIEGISDFIAEGMKFLYYIIVGYIPVKSLVTV